jgi:multicomponent Na+:H+ antiporter subunit F
MTTQDVALALVGFAVLAATIRVARGPSAADRAIGAELVFIAAVGAIALIAARTDTPVLFDLALVAVLIGFLATVALARLVHRPDYRSDERADRAGESPRPGNEG